MLLPRGWRHFSRHCATLVPLRCYHVDGATLAAIARCYHVDGATFAAIACCYRVDGATFAAIACCYRVDGATLVPLHAATAWMAPL